MGSSTNANTKNGGEWQELMGKDLMLKIIDSKPAMGQKKNDPPQAVQPQDTVLINFTCRPAKTSTSSLEKNIPVIQEASNYLVVVGAGDVVPALEMGIRFMAAGQTGQIWSHARFAFGPAIRKAPKKKLASDGTTATNDPFVLSPNSNVLYQVTVLQIVMDTSQLNPYFTIQKALSRKKIANDIYQYEWQASSSVDKGSKSNDENINNKDSENDDSNNDSEDDDGEDDKNNMTKDTNKNKYEDGNESSNKLSTSDDKPIADCSTSVARALKLYTTAAKDMDTLLEGVYFSQVEERHPQRLQAHQIRMDCYNNIAAVHLRSKEYHQAKLAAVQALQRDAHNIKALLRAAKSSLLDPASTLEEVQAALDAASQDITYKHVQEEQELKRLQQQFKRTKHRYREQEKMMFGDKLKTKSKPSSLTKEETKEKTTTRTTSIETTNESILPPSSIPKTKSVFGWRSHLLSISTSIALLALLIGIVHLKRTQSREAHSFASNDL